MYYAFAVVKVQPIFGNTLEMRPCQIHRFQNGHLYIQLENHRRNLIDQT